MININEVHADCLFIVLYFIVVYHIEFSLHKYRVLGKKSNEEIRKQSQ